LAQQQISPGSINAAIAALRFFFNVTLERPDLVRPLTTVNKPRRAPVVLSPEEVTRLLEAAPTEAMDEGHCGLPTDQLIRAGAGTRRASMKAAVTPLRDFRQAPRHRVSLDQIEVAERIAVMAVEVDRDNDNIGRECFGAGRDRDFHRFAECFAAGRHCSRQATLAIADTGGIAFLMPLAS